jgi:SAM-dependent methyltransferase
MADYYNQNGDAFFERTAHLDMGAIWSAFLEPLPQRARILDAGCGSGRDARHFGNLGHDITAIDASPRMVELASNFTGLPVRELRLQDLDYRDEFDGVWCCAAALHVPPAELPAVLRKLHESLKPGGVCYLSFKSGDGVRQDGSRQFLDMSLETLASETTALEQVAVRRSWTTQQTRGTGRTQLWTNQISQRAPGNAVPTEKSETSR